MAALSTPAQADEENFDAQGNWIGDIQTYARHCGEVVGAQIPDFSCEAQGVEIPITVNGRIMRGGAAARCDRPAFMSPDSEACQTGSRLGRFSFDDPDIRGVFICRRDGPSQGALPLYNEIAIILNNQRNGATCWSIARAHVPGGQVMTGDVLSPAKSETANAGGAGAWESPAQFPCIGCHRPDPFVFTPYVAQVKVGGKSVVPRFYEGPDGLDARFWNPLMPTADAAIPHKAVFSEGSEASICTSCHAIGARKAPNFAPEVIFLPESLGRPSAGAAGDDRQANRATMPKRAWMHFEHPHLLPPFSLAPVNTPLFGRVAVSNAVLECAARGSPHCDTEPFRGRPPKAVEFSPDFPPIDVEPGLLVRIAARQRNHDLGEVLKITIQHASGRVQRLGTRIGFDQPVGFRPDCEPGQSVLIRATLVDSDGQSVTEGGLPVAASRRLDCVEPTLTRWLTGPRTLEAVVDTTMSGGVVGPRVSFPVAGLTVGDLSNREARRLFLTFPITPPVETAGPVSATLRLPFEALNGDTRTLGPLRITHYRYGSELTSADFFDADSVRDGFTRTASADGVRTVDVTRHVRTAWEAGDGRVQFGIWFEKTSDGDRSFDIVRLVNAARADDDGGRNFETLEQPLLSVTFE